MILYETDCYGVTIQNLLIIRSILALMPIIVKFSPNVAIPWLHASKQVIQYEINNVFGYMAGSNYAFRMGYNLILFRSAEVQLLVLVVK